MGDLWSIMMLLWDFTFIATIANVWELWSLSDFYDVSWLCYESIWLVKVYSHFRKGYEALLDPLWSLG